MSYVKLFKVVSDFALGFQTLNQARDNNEAVKDLYDANHGTGIDGFSTTHRHNPFNSVGHHDDILIARTVIHCTVDTTLPIPELVIAEAGPLLARTPKRLGQGQWQLYLDTAQLFGAIATPKSTASVDRKATCFQSYATTGPQVTVTTWDRAGGSWNATDQDFLLVLYAQSY